MLGQKLGVRHGGTRESKPIGDAGAQAARQTHAATLVAARDARERCARSRARRLQARKCEKDRDIAETLSGEKPAPQGWRLSLGLVDADLLHQPRREEFAQDRA